MPAPADLPTAADERTARIAPVNGLEDPARAEPPGGDDRRALRRALPPDHVPIHYAFTARPVRDRLLLKSDGTPERFAAAVASHAPDTTVRILDPGQPLTLEPAAGANLR
jgi:hypothetical protein